jgi:hypothetical protein
MANYQFESFKGKDLVQMKIRANQLGFENERLREALRPFAGVPETSEAETAVSNESPVTIRCQLGDVRRALDALNLKLPS